MTCFRLVLPANLKPTLDRNPSAAWLGRGICAPPPHQPHLPHPLANLAPCGVLTVESLRVWPSVFHIIPIGERERLGRGDGIGLSRLTSVHRNMPNGCAARAK